MAKSAMGKLQEADELNKTAARIRARDPESARALNDLASTKRRAAIRQMKRRPKRRKVSSRVVL